MSNIFNGAIPFLNLTGRCIICSDVTTARPKMDNTNFGKYFKQGNHCTHIAGSSCYVKCCCAFRHYILYNARRAQHITHTALGHVDESVFHVVETIDQLLYLT